MSRRDRYIKGGSSVRGVGGICPAKPDECATLEDSGCPAGAEGMQDMYMCPATGPDKVGKA
jgi:hypothetical protein